MIVTTQRN